jgi:hypothetical protein
MTGAAPTLIQLLADCDSLGIRLLVAGADGLTIDAPKDALTPDLLDRLKAHKPELLESLRPTPEVAPPVSAVAENRPATPVCRCGSTAWRDFPIHGGRSVRRDCAVCRRFIDFPIWYGTGLTA